MSLLLDTQAFLWIILRSKKVKARAFEAISDPGTAIFLSAASAWEIAIKAALGKLQLPGEPSLYVPKRMQESGVSPLAVTHHHALAVHRLPMHHNDPFDRLIIAQAQLEGLSIVTGDRSFDAYDVRVVWL